MGGAASRADPHGAAGQLGSGPGGAGSSRAGQGVGAQSGGTHGGVGGGHGSGAGGHAGNQPAGGANQMAPGADNRAHPNFPPLLRDTQAESIVSEVVSTLLAEDERIRNEQEAQKRAQAEAQRAEAAAKASAAELARMPEWINPNPPREQFADPLVNTSTYITRILNVSIAFLKMQPSDTPEPSVEGSQTGFGYARFVDGSVYEGEWVDGYMHGYGVYIWTDGATYEGQWRKGQMHGRGKLDWPDRSYYVGQFHEGHRHGKGTFYHYASGTSYSGDWVFGIRHGRGRMDYGANGTAYYIGEFRDGVRHGLGRLVYVDIPVRPDSESNNSAPKSKSPLPTLTSHQLSTLPGPVVYEGSWENDKKHGWGAMCWGQSTFSAANKDSSKPQSIRGSSYIGWWKSDSPAGEGEAVWDVDLSDLIEELYEQRMTHEKTQARRKEFLSVNPVDLTMLVTKKFIEDELQYFDVSESTGADLHWEFVPWANESKKRGGTSPAGASARKLAAGFLPDILANFTNLSQSAIDAFNRLSRFDGPGQPFTSRMLSAIASLFSSSGDKTVTGPRNQYIGYFNEGKRHGSGTLILSTGASYAGSWQDDAKEGLGTFVFESGFIHRGQFVNDKLHDDAVWNAAATEASDGQFWNLPVHDILSDWARKRLSSKQKQLQITRSTAAGVADDNFQLEKPDTSLEEPHQSLVDRVNTLLASTPSGTAIQKLMKSEATAIANVFYRNYTALLDILRYYSSLAPFFGAADEGIARVRDTAPKDLVLTVDQIWRLLCDVGLSSPYFTRADLSRLAFYRLRQCGRAAPNQFTCLSHDETILSVCGCNDEHEEARLANRLDSIHDPTHILSLRQVFELLVRIAIFVNNEVPRSVLPKSTSFIMENAEASINHLYSLSDEQQRLIESHVSQIIEESERLRATLIPPPAPEQTAQQPQQQPLSPAHAQHHPFSNAPAGAAHHAAQATHSAANQTPNSAAQATEALAKIASLPSTIENHSALLDLSVFDIENIHTSTCPLIPRDGSLQIVAPNEGQVATDGEDMNDEMSSASPADLLKWLIVQIILPRAKSVSLIQSAIHVIPPVGPTSGQAPGSGRPTPTSSPRGPRASTPTLTLGKDGGTKSSSSALVTPEALAIPVIRTAGCAVRDPVRRLYRVLRANERRVEGPLGHSIEDPEDEEALREELEDSLFELDPEVTTIESLVECNSTSKSPELPADQIIPTCKGARTLLGRQYLPSSHYSEPSNWRVIATAARQDPSSWPGASWGHFSVPFSLAPTPGTELSSVNASNLSNTFAIKPLLANSDVVSELLQPEQLITFCRKQYVRSGLHATVRFSNRCRAPVAALRTRTITVRSVLSLLAQRGYLDPILPRPLSDGRSFIERYLRGEPVSSSIALEPGQTLVPVRDALRTTPSEEVFAYSDGFGEFIFRIDIGNAGVLGNLPTTDLDPASAAQTIPHQVGVAGTSVTAGSTSSQSGHGIATAIFSLQQTQLDHHGRKLKDDHVHDTSQSTANSATASTTGSLSGASAEIAKARVLELARRIQEAQLLSDHSLTFDSVLRLFADRTLLPEEREARKRYLCAVYIFAAGLFVSTATQRMREEDAVRTALREAEAQRQKYEQEQAAAQAAQAAADSSRSQFGRTMRGQRQNNTPVSAGGSSAGSSTVASQSARPTSGRGVNANASAPSNANQTPSSSATSLLDSEKSSTPGATDDQAVSDITIRLQAHRVGLHALASALAVRDKESILGLELTEEEFLVFLVKFSVLRAALKQSREEKLERYRKAVANVKNSSASSAAAPVPEEVPGQTKEPSTGSGSQPTKAAQLTIATESETPEQLLKCFLIFHREIVEPFLPQNAQELEDASSESKDELKPETDLPFSIISLLTPYNPVTPPQLRYCMMVGQNPNLASPSNPLQRFLFGVAHKWWFFKGALDAFTNTPVSATPEVPALELTPPASPVAETSPSSGPGSGPASPMSPSTTGQADSDASTPEQSHASTPSAPAAASQQNIVSSPGICAPTINSFTQSMLRFELNNHLGLLLPEQTLSNFTDDALAEGLFMFIEHLLDEKATPPSFATKEHSLQSAKLATLPPSVLPMLTIANANAATTSSIGAVPAPASLASQPQQQSSHPQQQSPASSSAGHKTRSVGSAAASPIRVSG